MGFPTTPVRQAARAYVFIVILGVALASSGVREFGRRLGLSWIHGSGFRGVKLQP
jgi:hypothetical protein